MTDNTPNNEIYPTNEQILNHEEQVLRDYKLSLPIKYSKPLNMLLPQYKDNSTLYEKCKHLYLFNLKNYYESRRDGNCFYRSFLFSLLNNVIQLKYDVSLKVAMLYADRLISKLAESYSFILQAGYEEVAVEDFYLPLVDIVTELKNKLDQNLTQKDYYEILYSKFNDDNVSSYYVWYLRCWTACYLRANKDEFQYSIDMSLYRDFNQYVLKEVEAMGAEADMVHVAAMKDMFELNINIYYVDATESLSSVQSVFKQMSELYYSCDYIENVFSDTSIREQIRSEIKDLYTKYTNNQEIPQKLLPTLYKFRFSETDDTMVKLLYRPGHYDVVE